MISSDLLSDFFDHPVCDMLQIIPGFPYNTGAQLTVINAAGPAFGYGLPEIRMIGDVETGYVPADVNCNLARGQTGSGDIV